MTQPNAQKPSTTQPPEMTDAEAREIFDKAAQAETDPEKRANIELCREYFTNPTFRKWMSDAIARIVGVTE